MRSNIHNKIQDTIKERSQAKGWIAIKEHYVNGKKIDVLLQNIRTRHTIAAEVQLTYRHTLENVFLDFRAGCDEVWIISINKKISDRIERKARVELNSSVLEKVRFLIMEEFIPNLEKKKK
jgi:hypothetical protein